jgi:hypothetical protein
MTKKKMRELAKALDTKPKWNAVNTYSLKDLTHDQAKEKGDLVYEAWLDQTLDIKPTPPSERPKYFKI